MVTSDSEGPFPASDSEQSSVLRNNGAIQHHVLEYHGFVRPCMLCLILTWTRHSGHVTLNVGGLSY
jgi:hypothetical protein